MLYIFLFVFLSVRLYPKIRMYYIFITQYSTVLCLSLFLSAAIASLLYGQLVLVIFWFGFAVMWAEINRVEVVSSCSLSNINSVLLGEAELMSNFSKYDAYGCTISILHSICDYFIYTARHNKDCIFYSYFILKQMQYRFAVNFWTLSMFEMCTYVWWSGWDVRFHIVTLLLHFIYQMYSQRRTRLLKYQINNRILFPEFFFIFFLSVFVKKNKQFCLLISR